MSDNLIYTVSIFYMHSQYTYYESKNDISEYTPEQYALCNMSIYEWSLKSIKSLIRGKAVTAILIMSDSMPRELSNEL